MPNVQAASQPGSMSNKPWVARHKFLSGLALLFVVVVVVGTICAWPLLKARFHSQYAAALEEIRKSPQARERLGEPIAPVRFLPSGDFTDSTAKLTFEVEGPKDKAAVATFSRLIDGKWGFATLELKFANGGRIDLAQAIGQREGNDTPKFDPNAKQSEAQQPDMPVDIALPDLPAEPEKK